MQPVVCTVDLISGVPHLAMKRANLRLTAIYVGMTRRIQDDAISKRSAYKTALSSFLLLLFAKGVVFRTVLKFLQL